MSRSILSLLVAVVLSLCRVCAAQQGTPELKKPGGARDYEGNPKQDYHYFRNAETYLEVGNALGLAMVKLLNKASK